MPESWIMALDAPDILDKPEREKRLGQSVCDEYLTRAIGGYID